MLEVEEEQLALQVLAVWRIALAIPGDDHAAPPPLRVVVVRGMQHVTYTSISQRENTVEAWAG